MEAMAAAKGWNERMRENRVEVVRTGQDRTGQGEE